VARTYDVAGLPETLTDGAGEHVFQHTARSRLTRETIISGPLAGSVVDVAYDLYGRRKRLASAAQGAGLPEMS
jgi:hypothetical protein